MHDIITRKVLRDENEVTGQEEIRTARVHLDPRDIYFHEEYSGEPLEGFDVLTIIHMYEGNVVCVIASFDEITQARRAYKATMRAEAIWRLN